MAKKVTLADLSDADKANLLQQLQQQQNEKDKELAAKRKEYKALVHEKVNNLFPVLAQASSVLSGAKGKAIEYFKQVLEFKNELYPTADGQTSHTFTNEDGSISIIIGYNMLDSYDDTVHSGVAMVKEYMSDLVARGDKETKSLVDGIMRLLSKDSKGNLKPSRVAQLKKMADETGNEKFINGVKIIQDSHMQVRSKEFVRCIQKDKTGKSMVLALSITDAEIPADKQEVAE